MSAADNHTSDIKKAADHVDTEQIENNLTNKQDPKTPESLTKEQKTPFINDDIRTDK